MKPMWTQWFKEMQTICLYGNFIAIPHGTDAAKKSEFFRVAIVPSSSGELRNARRSKVVTVLFGIAGLGDEHLEIIKKISIFCADVDNVVKLGCTIS